MPMRLTNTSVARMERASEFVRIEMKRGEEISVR